MKKAFALLLAGLLFVPSAYAWKPFGGGYKQQVTASDIEADNTNFNGNCTGADNVQECLDLLDDAAGGGSVSDAAYGVGWNGDTTTAPSKNAVYDKIETIASGGEVNTASNLGGGLDNYSTKVGVDLRFNSFSGTDFDLATNLITIDASIARDAEVAASYQPLDSDLTTIAGLTATTDNFIVSVASAWASRTPAQVRTTLGLVIGTNVQAWDTNLDTWAGITPGAGVGTFLATPSSANLASALTDETGTLKAVFSDSPVFTSQITSPIYLSASADPADSGAIRLGNGELISWEANPAGTDKTLGVDTNNVLTSSVPINATNGYRIGNSATSGRYLKGDGTNFIQSSGSASGTGSCTNQAVTATNSDSAPTCSTITSSYVDTSVLTTAVHQSGSPLACSDAGANDTYTCSLSPSLSAYATGQVVYLKANTANTGTATININSLGAKTITKTKGTTLADNDIKAGQWVPLIYDGTNFEIFNGIPDNAGGSGSPGGSNTQLQYNNSSAFGGIAGFTTNGSNLTQGDTYLFDASGVNNSSTTEGIKLPQATDVSAGTAEGQIGWDTDDDKLYVGDGTSVHQINGIVYATSVPLAAATRYVSPFSQTQDATATNIDDFEIPYTCKAKNLRFRVQTAPGAAASGKAYTATVWTGPAGSGASTALTCQIFETAVNCSDTTHTVTLTAGNVLFWELLRTGAATNSNASVSFECS